ncbi:MAG: rhomboid family intramembrane serine protease [Bacteroidota bacterium]
MDNSNFRNFNFNNQNQHYDRRPASPLDGIKRFFTGKSMLSRLIIINILVFLLVNLVKLFFFLFQVSPLQTGSDTMTIMNYWLAVPSNLDLLLQKPWTLFTYMFLHENLWHLFFNMLMLYFGGVIFTEYLGSKKLLITYILGGLVGATFYIAAYNLFPAFALVVPFSIAFGASASVLAIIVAIAAYIPDYNVRMLFIGQIKFKWVAVAFVVLDLLSIEKDNPGGHIAHLGGAFFGLVYILALKKGVIAKQFLNPIKKLFKPKAKPKMKATYSYKKPLTDDQYNYDKKLHQQKIDSILDKIKKSGYESLSKDDKELLFKESKK